MNENEFLIVNKKILPPYFEKVLETRKLLETGAVSDVSAAVKITGISRSTYYKYKDYIFTPDFGDNLRKAVLSMLLSHEIGMLNKVLSTLADMSASVLSISQSLPIHNSASIVITLDIGKLNVSLENLVSHISEIPGVEKASLVLVE